MASHGKPFDKVILDETYEATIVVKRSRLTKTANANGYFDDGSVPTSGVLAEIKVHSASLVGLQNKIKQHTDLIEDE